MLQEYLPGEEYSVDIYVRRDGRVIAAVPRVRMKIDSGIAVASRTIKAPEVCEAAVRTAEIIGIRGCRQRPVQARGRWRVQAARGQSALSRDPAVDRRGRHRHAQADGRRAGGPDGAGQADAVQGADGRSLLDRALSSMPSEWEALCRQH